MRIAVSCKKHIRRFVVPILFCAVAGAIAFGQNQTSPQRGFLPSASYAISDLETINTVNGNLIYNVPLVALPPGRAGLSADIKLVYNSQIYDIRQDYSTYSQSEGHPALLTSNLQNSQAGGWRYGFGYGLELEERPNPTSTWDCGSNDPTNWRVYRLSVTLADGSRHVLHPYAFPNNLGDGYYEIGPGGIKSSCAPNQTPVSGTLTYHTSDGTFINVQIEDNGTNWALRPWTMFFPDGRKVTGIVDQANRLYDRNDNYVDILNVTMPSGYPGTKLVDQMNREISIEYVTSTGPQYSTVDYVRRKAYGGASDLTWTVTWGSVSIGPYYYTCNAEEGQCVATTQHRVVTRIDIPNVSGLESLFYAFAYDDDITPYGGYGELNDVTLPSGTRARYNYNEEGLFKFFLYALTDNPVSRKQLDWVDEQSEGTPVISEVWTYVFTNSSSTITNPDGGAVTSYFYDPSILSNWSRGLVYKTVQPNGDVLERLWARNRPYNLPDQDPGNPYVRTEYHSVNSGATPVKTAVKDFRYDRNGNLVSAAEYDWIDYAAVQRDGFGFPSGVPANAVRTTVNAFYATTAQAGTGTETIIDESNAYWNPGSPRVRNAITLTEVTSAGVPQSATEFTYDLPLTRANLAFERRWDSSKAAVYASPLTGSNAIVFQHVYDSYGNRTFTYDALVPASQTQYVYGSICGFSDLYVTEIVEPMNTHTQKDYDCSTGLEKSSIALGNNSGENITQSTAYDNLGRANLIKEAAGSAWERQTQIVYQDAARRIVVRRDLDAAGDKKLVVISHYDPLGRIRLSRQLENAASQSETDETVGLKVQSRYRYSGANQYRLVSTPYRASTPDQTCPTQPCAEPTMGWTVTVLDPLGRVISTQSFDGAARPAPWGANGGSTGAVTMNYDSYYATVTDEAGKARRSRTDALGRLMESTEGYGSVNYLTSYTYNVLDDLLSVAQNGLAARTFEYNSLKRLVRAYNPESGWTCYGQYVTSICQAQYDGNGNLRFRTDARGTVTQYTYDGLNRIIGKAYTPAGGAATTLDVSYAYSATTTPYSKNRLTTMVNSVSTMTYTAYDALGRVTASKQTTQGIDYAFGVSNSQPGYRYNLGGGLKEMTYPSGRVVTTTYDTAGRAATISGQKGVTSASYVTAADYAPHGTLTRMDLGNGLRESSAFNSRLQPSSIGSTRISNSAVVLNLALNWGSTNNNGNLMGQTINAGGPVYTQSYTYDALNRLKTAAETGNWSQTYVYDERGNRAVLGGAGLYIPGGPLTPQVTNDTPADVQAVFPNNRWTGATHDPSGNGTGMGTRTLSYDAENRIASTSAPGTTTMDYAYDGDGRRVRKVAGAQTTIYVYNALGQLAAEYATPTPVGPSGRQFITQDHLGSTRLITDSAGVDVGRHDFLPFGEEIDTGIGSRAGTYDQDGGFRQRFTAKERDAETGLDYFDARYFSGAQGRFTSVDPDNAGASVSDPQSWNAYGYVRNNPLTFVDPFGESCIKTDDDKRADDGDGKGCTAAGVKPDKGGKPGEIDPQQVTVGVGGDEARLIVLSRIGENFTSPHQISTVVSGGVQGAVAVDSGRGLLGLGWDLVRGLMGVRAAGVAVGVGGGRRIGSMVVLRTLRKGESIADLIEEAKTIGYEMQTEVAVVKLANGERALVTGGAEGISFGEGSIVRLYGHTHPFPTGPSSLDFQAIRTLGQRSSWIYEAGGLTKFTVK
jgi:RHS repeat-associated protein